MGNKVAIISYQFSVVVKSIEKGLSQEGYKVELIGDSLSQITDKMNTTDVFLMYLPDKMIDEEKKIYNLLLICDKFKDTNRKIILIGNDREHDDFLKAVPALKEFPWINRPVNMLQLQAELQHEAQRLDEKKAKKKVLIIDDDFTYGQTVITWLKSDYDIEAVTDGMSGIAYLMNNKVDLVLLDYEMPVVDGPKILEMLRIHPDTSSIPVIFLTGNGTKEGIMRVMSLKPQGYVLKTTTRQDLKASLKDYFENKHRVF